MQPTISHAGIARPRPGDSDVAASPPARSVASTRGDSQQGSSFGRPDSAPGFCVVVGAMTGTCIVLGTVQTEYNLSCMPVAVDAPGKMCGELGNLHRQKTDQAKQEHCSHHNPRDF